MLGAVIMLLAAVIAYAVMLTRDRNLRLEAARNRMGDILSDVEFTKGALQQSIDDLRSQLEEERHRYTLASELSSKRIDELISQNQNLAERVASLRRSGFDEGGDDFHIEAPTPQKPFAPALQEFYSGIEHPAAQDAAEDFILAGREMGMEDEQILRELEEDWSAGFVS